MQIRKSKASCMLRLRILSPSHIQRYFFSIKPPFLPISIKEGSKEDYTSDSRHLGLMGLEGTLCGSYDHVTLRDGGAHIGVGDPPAFQERLEVGQDAGVALAAQRAQHEAKTGRPSRRLHRAPPHRAHAGLVVALQRQHPPVRIVPTPQPTTGHSERREREKMIELTASQRAERERERKTESQRPTLKGGTRQIRDTACAAFLHVVASLGQQTWPCICQTRKHTTVVIFVSINCQSRAYLRAEMDAGMDKLSDRTCRQGWQGWQS